MKKPHFKIRFINCDSVDYDYTIVPDLSGISDYLQMCEEDLEKSDAKIEITGIEMTEAEYGNFISTFEP